MENREVFRRALLCKPESIQKAIGFTNQNAVFDDKSERQMTEISMSNVQKLKCIKEILV